MILPRSTNARTNSATSQIFPNLFESSDEHSSPNECGAPTYYDDSAVSLSAAVNMYQQDSGDLSSASTSSAATARPISKPQKRRRHSRSSRSNTPGSEPLAASEAPLGKLQSASTSSLEICFRVIFLWALSLSLLIYMTCGMLKGLITPKARLRAVSTPSSPVTFKHKRSKSSSNVRKPLSRSNSTVMLSHSAPHSRRSSQINLYKLSSRD